jgi:hypothetical protein
MRNLKRGNTMPKREILREQWMETFQAFTSKHIGQLVRLSVTGMPSAPEVVGVEAKELPLHEISADLKDQENSIMISLGLPSEILLRHSILSVAHVYITQAEDGSESTVEVQSSNGQTTTLNLHVPVPIKS